MSGGADLPRQDAAIPHFGGTREADLAAQQRVLANFAGVADLHEVVDFRAAADARLADRGAVDGGVRLNFDIVADDGGTGLADFVPAPVGFAGESEAVTADDDAILQQDAMADAAIFADTGVGVGEKIVADARAAINRNEAVQDSVIANGDIFIHEAVGADMRSRADSWPSLRSQLWDGCSERNAARGGRVRWRGRNRDRDWRSGARRWAGEARSWRRESRRPGWWRASRDICG